MRPRCTFAGAKSSINESYRWLIKNEEAGLPREDCCQLQAPALATAERLDLQGIRAAEWQAKESANPTS